jgi:hypothetical protein
LPTTSGIHFVSSLAIFISSVFSELTMNITRVMSYLTISGVYNTRLLNKMQNEVTPKGNITKKDMAHISVMLISQMIIAEARHSSYSSNTPPPPTIRLIRTVARSFFLLMGLSRK